MTTTTYDEIKNNSLKIEGLVNWMTAIKSHIIIGVLTRILIHFLKKFQEKIDLSIISKESAEELFSSLKNPYERLQKGIPIFMAIKSPLIGSKSKAKLVYYYRRIEDIIEALEIGLDTEAISKLELLAQETECSVGVRPWRDALAEI